MAIPRRVSLEIFSFAGMCNIPATMTTDYKEKYIASRDENRALAKEAKELRKTVDKQTKQLEKSTKTRKPREASFRNEMIGKIIRQLKEERSELSNPQRMTEANRLFDIHYPKHTLVDMTPEQKAAEFERTLDLRAAAPAPSPDLLHQP